MIRTSNPIFKKSVFSDASSTASGATMSIRGTVGKTFFLFLCLMLTSVWSWSSILNGSGSTGFFLLGAPFIALIFAIIMAFKPHLSPILAPIYALCEGFAIGGISSLFEKSYPGLVLQAVVLTFCVMGAMLFLYSNRIVQATDRFRKILFIGIGAIFLTYIMSMILGIFHVRIPGIFGSGPIGILFSIVVIGFASFSLILDFDFIEQATYHGAPKYMEWYAGFGLMVTLIWIYIEILRLLAKLSNRRS